MQAVNQFCFTISGQLTKPYDTFNFNPVQDIMKWVKDDWIEQMQRQHVEPDNAVNYIKRYLSGLNSFTEGMSVTQVRKFLRIAPSGKIQGQKYALAFQMISTELLLNQSEQYVYDGTDRLIF